MELISTSASFLLNFIGHACNNADSRQTGISAFDFVLIEANNGHLQITGSNGHQSFTRICTTDQIEVIGNGSLCVDAVKLFQVTRALPKNTLVKIKEVHGKDRAVLSCGKSRLQIKTIPVTEYPTVDIIKDAESSFTVQAKEFMNLISNVLYASGRNDVRHYLNGVYLNVNRGALFANASDGHRLCVNKMQVGKNVNKMGLLLPYNSMAVFTRLNEPAEEMTISYNSNRAEFNWGGLVYRTALIDGKYPEISRMFPAETKSKLKFNRLDFLELLKRLSVLVTDDKFPKLKLSSTEDQVKLQTVIDNEEDGLGEDMISAQTSGEQITYEFGINPKYLIDAISHMYTEYVTMEFTEANASCCVSPVGQITCKSLIMPVRI
ncbi:DNA polymerase III subunit beta [Vibrio parahaemolyticus]|uniref:DNA polymerase III subunit beta n=1 Tax=Vibrio TaxID=662 RepID=UPI001A8EEF99|nr:MULTISPECIES: DNA polymerase III subunit beta [Vibrio]EGQ7973605.1 DNA polymerase III subunit beta [Vibrio parahaemolyticus]MBO0209812.1 DNA polymerase III subunit beta [Vibrio sp. Vb0877]MCR9811875.1 DNA polymerase III subunit beta [Vibrio parahaemolyticus]MDW2320265.1 DNA polymerase III subunit beta [Vibrio sp. 1159]